eukprot:COSAG01_NODE_28694_length_655_cov_0.899281_1_plen_54_part_10
MVRHSCTDGRAATLCACERARVWLYNCVNGLMGGSLTMQVLISATLAQLKCNSL